LRERKNIERRIASGEVKYSYQDKAFVYTGDESKQVELHQINEQDSEDSDDAKITDQQGSGKNKN
jgi:hypothetical protein|tara:strand:+ start:316 stop:510 length:195 start_codon:yes stop_codon:yes gene_type:complete